MGNSKQQLEERILKENRRSIASALTDWIFGYDFSFPTDGAMLANTLPVWPIV